MDSVRSLTMYSTPRLRTFDDVEEDYADHEIFNCGEFYSCGGLNMYGFGFVMGLWFLASVVLIECIYGSESVLLGPNSSFLLEPSSIFVKSIKVKEQDYSKAGLQLYGFYGSPPLNRFINWSDSRVLPVSQNRYKAGLRFSGWPYYLNQGSSMKISYSVTPKGSAVQLVIHEGMRGISDSSLEESAFRDTAWSWNLIQGSGMIKLEISKSSNYYLAVHNLKRTDVEVELNIDVRAVLYDTKQSFYNCTFSNGECTFNAMSLVGNSVVITSPALSQGDTIEDAWYITYSYQHRLIAYVIATGLVICFMLAAVQFCNRLQCCGGHLRRVLADKYDNGSCNKPFINDDADLEEFVGDEGEARNRRCVCAICYDAPIDCFFLPCGHCVSCYQCGTKIKRVVGSCPICRHNMKKVKRICTA